MELTITLGNVLVITIIIGGFIMQYVGLISRVVRVETTQEAINKDINNLYALYRNTMASTIDSLNKTLTSMLKERGHFEKRI